MTTIRGVSDSQARARASRARRELAAIQREDAERIERVCAAIRELTGMSDEFKAEFARVILLQHPERKEPCPSKNDKKLRPS